MHYRFIEPLSDSDKALASEELDALRRLWLERKQYIQQSGGVDAFLLRLKREWAIETGIIERLYQWDRGVTEALIQRGIDAALIAHQAGYSEAKAHSVKDLIDDQQAIVDGLFEFIKDERPLTEHYIRQLQEAFTLHQSSTVAMTPEGMRVEVELIKGAYKQHPNNPRRPDETMHEYCPPEHVATEMQNLVRWFTETQKEAAPEVLAAWLHHRFTQIHPFQDGNGRVARALATLVFLQRQLFPLVIRDSDREEYIQALEVADNGDLAKLVELFVRRQKEAILQAITVERETRKAEHLDHIIQAAIRALRTQHERERAQMNAVFEVADELVKHTYERLSQVANTIKAQLQAVASDQDNYYANARVCRDNEKNSHYFLREIVATARELNYYANTNVYRGWAQLVIHVHDAFNVLFSVHGMGTEFQGVMAISACTFRRTLGDAGTTEVVSLKPTSREPFQLNYVETKGATRQRFELWLEHTLTIALEEWRRSIAS